MFIEIQHMLSMLEESEINPSDHRVNVNCRQDTIDKIIEFQNIMQNLESRIDQINPKSSKVSLKAA
jgi:hypothetical protein